MIPQPNPQPWPGPCTQYANSKKLSSISMSISASVTPSSGNGNITGTGDASASWTRDDTFPCWEILEFLSPPPAPVTGGFADCVICCQQDVVEFDQSVSTKIGSWSCTPESGPAQTGYWDLELAIENGTMPGTYLLSGSAVIYGNITCCFGNSSVGNFSADNIAPEDLIGSHSFTYTDSAYGSTITFTIDIS